MTRIQRRQPSWGSGTQQWAQARSTRSDLSPGYICPSPPSRCRRGGLDRFRAGGACMRKVVLYELLSLDGVAEDPDKFVIDWDEAMDANLAAVIATQDAVILGRRSYDEWSEFWPGSEIEPFAEVINGVTQYVATSEPLDRYWATAREHTGGRV